jgi:hypothetical protein
MTDILILCFIVFALSFTLGWRGREWYATRVVDKLLNTHRNEISENIMNVHMEVERGNFYIYDSSNNAFITQVKTKEEMFDFFTQKYPNKTVMMTRSDLELFDAS